MNIIPVVISIIFNIIAAIDIFTGKDPFQVAVISTLYLLIGHVVKKNESAER